MESVKEYFMESSEKQSAQGPKFVQDPDIAHVQHYLGPLK